MKTAELICMPGAVVTCPECSDEIGVTTEALYQEHTLGFQSIRFKPHQYPSNGQSHCRRCGCGYAEIEMSSAGRKMLIHTTFGWLPRPPPNVAPPPRARLIANAATLAGSQIPDKLKSNSSQQHRGVFLETGIIGLSAGHLK